jgi:CheY-like chemotaxis protein
VPMEAKTATVDFLHWSLYLGASREWPWRKMKSRKKHILVVDDEPAWLRSMAMELRRVGYDVKEAQSASQALSLLAKYHPDLIVSDLRMPDMNGFDLLEKIRHSPSTSATPVVFFSAIDDFHAKKIARELGATACLLKPYDKQDLVSILKQYLPR